MSDSFLSDEDLDLRNLSWEELLAWWRAWLVQAQSTNDRDEHLYSHGVFRVEPGWMITPTGVEPANPRSASRNQGTELDARHASADRDHDATTDAFD